MTPVRKAKDMKYASAQEKGNTTGKRGFCFPTKGLRGREIFHTAEKPTKNILFLESQARRHLELRRDS